MEGMVVWVVSGLVALAATGYAFLKVVEIYSTVESGRRRNSAGKS